MQDRVEGRRGGNPHAGCADCGGVFWLGDNEGDSMSAACKYDNSYNTQRVMFWARKIKELDPEEFQKLVDLWKPEKEILDRAKAENEKGI
jgi:hypothetical protein